MHGLLVALGAAAEALAGRDSTAFVTDELRLKRTIFQDDAPAFAILESPDTAGSEHCVLKDAATGIWLALDGYLWLDDDPALRNQVDHAQALCARIRKSGLPAALASVRAGAFNIACFDFHTSTFAVANDAFGTIPLYYATLTDGLVASTSPVALTETGLVNRALDNTAFAQWIFYGYHLGTRTLCKGVRTALPGTVFLWRKNHGLESSRLPYLPSMVAPERGSVQVRDVAEALEQACSRIQRLGNLPAHLQSGGMDSRIILAAWPRETNPDCYTYGVKDSTELWVAREVARTRGSSFHSATASGDEVAECFDNIFAMNGLLVYPDRYLIGQTIATTGISSLLDGFLGDVLIGGSYYQNDRGLTSWSKFGHKLTYFIDQKIEQIGIERIADAMHDTISEVRSAESLHGYLSPECIASIEAQRPAIREDLIGELEAAYPATDSVALMYRNFLIANRGRNAISQQCVMSRGSLRIACPFTNDFDLLRLLLKLSPEETAYRRFYIRLFSRAYPLYADIPYGDSMLPLRRGPLAHKLSGYFLSNGLRLPLLTPERSPTRKSAIAWDRWLRESAALREQIQSALLDANMARPDELNLAMQDIAQGRKAGNGKLTHIAAAARWAA